MTEKIPRATAKRIPVYYRYLKFLKRSGVERISSTELSEEIQIDSATIRRDFSYFGTLGRRGYGYNVDYLIDFFSKILNQDRVSQVALVGVGNLGNALLSYNFHKNSNVAIAAAFDVNPALIGTQHDGATIYSMDELEKVVQDRGIDVAILTVPMEVAEEVTDRLVTAGIKGILNFTPLRLNVPSEVIVNNVDLSNELQMLVYLTDTNMDISESED